MQLCLQSLGKDYALAREPKHGKVRGVTIKKLEEQGLSRTEAERQWDALFAEKAIKHEQTEVIKALDKKIEVARKSGDTSEFLRLKHERKLQLIPLKKRY